MCYLIAKKFDERGCLAIEVERGKTLSALVSYLGRKTLDRGVQILTVSDMEAYGEYSPYNLIQDESDFIARVLAVK